ncbi:PSBY1 [Auxenochlorella protothecoides x Auxenochlorella symbiontica]
MMLSVSHASCRAVLGRTAAPSMARPARCIVCRPRAAISPAHIAAATSMPMSLLSASPAHAVSEVAQLADGRASLLGLLLVPVLGWVLFNIGQPALNQLKQINDSKSGNTPGRKRRSVVGAAGIGTALALAMAQSADAVSEIGQLADGRGNLFLLPLFPALGWVLFNIAQPAKNQLDNMRR